ncbi:class I SAM-dependent methyltransferase [Ectothiorhodospira mobilis]|uniref:class I SAM-dependent methyltransferase n=1 Tax=Ectothiorhodospira mobilis TaxID=195064 RepID=UPI001EE7A123|nr:methyltransferase domain-containing protein [Ectothiorhodospira mobilis]MCG5535338.1 class I SAM-dependent methyltransferase [Ectothiorhodospira mobilis]
MPSPTHPIVQRQQHLRAWYAAPAGRVMLTAMRGHLHRFVPQIFGYYALQIGHLGSGVDLLEGSRIGRRFLMEALPEPGAHLSALPEALPVAADTLDLILLAHTLDGALDPHQVLREVERTLRPEGHVIILGLNPLSPVGLWQRVPPRRGGIPWSGACYSTRRVREWLSLLGFDIMALAHAGVRAPEGGTGLRGRLQMIQGLGGRRLPYVGSVYMILARKRVSTLTPVRPRWRAARPWVPGGFVRPVCRRRERD